ncbi:MAG: ABC transporter ATP-binding protein [Cutibacterium avidum]|nr:ABC transporter ATP-binding protein [Cutibacterium avidum]MDU1536096.1 ABC transporter ATP-binding protein [Cutibacterium avidum]MDU5516073.1 ABC transporter ATP-binding protein [Cutibacterium avidum]MDU5967428.1 ABC transporter ATP-binding protein [Cutibacterium avidum]
MTTQIEVEDLHLHLGPRGAGIDALDGISLHVGEGERLGLVGESGSGKSTLLKVMMALRRPDSGTVRFRGRSLSDIDAVRDLRRSAAMVFQDPRSSLDPRMNIGRAITEPLRSPVARRMTREERKDRLAEVMVDVGLDPESASRFPHEFSGGQRQRIAIARALVTEPDVLLADEPVSALDVSVRAQVLNLLNDLVRQRGLTMVFVSHDLAVVRHLCDTVAVMSAGRIVERGRLSDVYRDPQHEVTQELLTAIPRIRVDDSTH